MELAELGGVDVDGDLVGFAGEVVRGVAGDGQVETDAEGEEEVAVLQGEVGAAGGDGAGAADVGGVVGGDEVGGAPGGDGGDAEELAELFELGFGAGEADAVAGEEQRALGGVECFDDARRLRRGCWRCRGLVRPLASSSGSKRAEGGGVVDGRGLDVERDVDPDGAGAAVEGEVDGLFEVVADVERARGWSRRTW